jgi:hypothetical protein
VGTPASAARKQSCTYQPNHELVLMATCMFVSGICRHNYLGTWELMQVSSQMEQLRAFVHISTHFVNNHLPRNSLVKEQLYPLPLELHGEPVGHRYGDMADCTGSRWVVGGMSGKGFRIAMHNCAPGAASRASGTQIEEGSSRWQQAVKAVGGRT